MLAKKLKYLELVLRSTVERYLTAYMETSAMILDLKQPEILRIHIFGCENFLESIAIK